MRYTSNYISLILLFLYCIGYASFLNAQPCKEVVGYYPAWQWYDRGQLVNPATLDYSQYTIINYAFFAPQADGTIVGTDEWADENLLLGQINWATSPPSYLENTSLIDIAHNNGVKVMVSIGGWTLSNDFPNIAADPILRANFVDGCVNLLETYGFDGIDIDWEYPGYAPHNGTANDYNTFALLMQDIRTAIDAYGTSIGQEMLLSAAMGASPSNAVHINWPVIVNTLDMINLMSYDYHGTWSPVSNHNAPLYAPQQGDPATNIAASFDMLTEAYAVPPEQINIGIAFYGRTVTGCSGLHQPHNGGTDNTIFWADEGSPMYYNILANMNQFTTHWDSFAEVPYLLGDGNSTFVSYDDEVSISLKAEYVVDNNARGVIIWEITGDYVETAPNSGVIAGTPLATALNTGLCNTTNPPSPQPDLSISALNAAPNMLMAGETSSISHAVDNIGTAAAPSSTVYYYLSSDMLLDGDDVLLDMVTAADIATGAMVSLTHNLTIPANTAAGTWYIIVLADGVMEIAESNETNNTASISITVNTPPLPPDAAFTSNLGAICVGESIQFSDASTNSPTTWSWTFTGGAPVNAATQNPLVSYNTAGTYDVSLTVTNTHGSDNTTVNGFVTVYPVANATAGNDVSICMGQNTPLTASGGTQYAWSPTSTLSDATIANPIASPSISTLYSVTVTTANNCSDVAQVLVEVSPTLLNITGNTSVITGASETYSVAATTGSTYNWTVPTGATLLSGQGTAQIVINWAETGGTVYLTETSAAGCVGVTQSIEVTVLTPTAGGCPTRPSTYYINPDNYINTGEILLGEARLFPVWADNADANIPDNRKTWAMGLVHASQVFNNVLGTSDILPLNAFWATSIKESFAGCDANISPNPSDAYPLTYQAASIGDGCFQIENTSAYSELNQLYPQRFPDGGHSFLVAGDNYETAALTKAYYDIFSIRFVEIARDWQPFDFFVNATDPMAGVKALSGAYNRGLWSQLVTDIFQDQRSAALATNDLMDIFTPASVEYDHAASISNYTQVLSDNVMAIEAGLQASNTFYNYYDELIAWADVELYIDKIAPLYPEVNMADLKTTVQPVFDSINGGNAISFRYDFGLVLDVIMRHLPLDDPTENIIYYYGCAMQTACETPQWPTPYDIGTNSASVSWASISNATNYEVRYRPVGTSTWTYVYSSTNNTALSGLLPNTSYEVQVAADCGGTLSNYSTTETFTTLDNSTNGCATPTNVSVNAMDVNGGNATITWTAVPNATSYTINYMPVGNPWWLTASSNTNSVTLWGLSANTTYDVQVQAICDSGNSNFSSPLLNFTLSDTPPPPTPTANLQLKLYLEAAYNTSTNMMEANLVNTGILPSTQPFGNLPYNYNGTESITTFALNVIDWVLVEARDPNNLDNIVAQRAALLLADGSVQDVNGAIGVNFETLADASSYYIVVRQRSHVDVLSSGLVSLPTSAPYNFTQASNVWGGSTQLTQVTANTYALHAGDFNGDGIISVADFNVYAAQSSSINQYLSTDVDLNASVSVSDFNWYNSNASVIGISTIRY